MSDLTDPNDPVVIDALTRKCSACGVRKGVWCLCGLHSPPHLLASCPTSTGRIVHHARRQPPQKGEK